MAPLHAIGFENLLWEQRQQLWIAAEHQPGFPWGGSFLTLMTGTRDHAGPNLHKRLGSGVSLGPAASLLANTKDVTFISYHRLRFTVRSTPHSQNA